VTPLGVVTPCRQALSGPVQVPPWNCVACAWTCVEKLISLTVTVIAAMTNAIITDLFMNLRYVLMDI